MKVPFGDRERHWTILAVALVAMIGASCESASEGGASPFSNPQIPEWTLAERQESTIGGADDRLGYALEGVRGAVFAGQHIVVADQAAGEIKVFARDGRLVVISGRMGYGPGEYQSMANIFALSDTSVVVWDPQRSLLTVVSVDGRVLSTVTPDLRDLEMITPKFVGVLAEGELVFRDESGVRGLREESTGERRDSITYVILDSEGSRTLARLPVQGTEVLFRNEKGLQIRTPIIFGRSPQATISGGALVLASTDSLSFSRRDGRGATLSVRSYYVEPVRVSSSAIATERGQREKELRRSIERFGRADFSITGGPTVGVFEELAATQVAQLPHRTTYPAFGTLKSGEDGALWVSEAVPHISNTTRWIVLDESLSLRGKLVLPRDMELLDVSFTGVLVRTRDTLDRERIDYIAIRR